MINKKSIILVLFGFFLGFVLNFGLISNKFKPLSYIGTKVINDGQQSVTLFRYGKIKDIVMSVSERDQEKSILISPANSSFPACRVLFDSTGIREIMALNSEQSAVTLSTNTDKTQFTKLVLTVPDGPNGIRVLQDDGPDGKYEKNLTIPAISPVK